MIQSRPNTNVRIRSQQQRMPARQDDAPGSPQSFPVEKLNCFGLSQVGRTFLPLCLGDVLAIGASVACLHALGSFWFASEVVMLGRCAVSVFVVAPLAFAIFELYPGVGLRRSAEIRKAAGATGLLTLLWGTIGANQSANIGIVGLALVGWPGFFLMVVTMRFWIRAICCRFSWWGIRLLVFGGEETGHRLYQYYRSRPQLGLRAVQIIDDWSSAANEPRPVPKIPLKQLQNEFRAKLAVITSPNTEISVSATAAYANVFPYVVVVSGLKRIPLSVSQTIDCNGLSAVVIKNRQLLPWNGIVKLLIDKALVAIGSVFFLPLIALIMLFVKTTSKGPVFYRQLRIGKNGNSFWAWKFRTMCSNADEVLESHLEKDPELRSEWNRDHKLRNDPRITTVGKFLRESSLDELPQIWNVWRGEMSLIGPRPIVEAEIVKYGDCFKLYSRVTPGITGLWQVSGRNNTTYDERVNLDAQYVLNWSLWLDLSILIRTVRVVILRDGAC